MAENLIFLKYKAQTRQISSPPKNKSTYRAQECTFFSLPQTNKKFHVQKYTENFYFVLPQKKHQKYQVFSSRTPPPTTHGNSHHTHTPMVITAPCFWSKHFFRWVITMNYSIMSRITAFFGIANREWKWTILTDTSRTYLGSGSYWIWGLWHPSTNNGHVAGVFRDKQRLVNALANGLATVRLTSRKLNTFLRMSVEGVFQLVSWLQKWTMEKMWKTQKRARKKIQLLVGQVGLWCENVNL